MMNSTTDTCTTLCTFRVGSMYLGVEVLRVQEVLRQHPITPVPQAPQAVSGLMNLRGQIVTAIDLRRCLELHDEEEPPVMNVVIRAEDEVVSLQVHEIGDVLVVDDDQFERAPDTLQGAARHLIHGVYKTDRGLLLALDADAVLQAAA